MGHKYHEPEIQNHPPVVKPELQIQHVNTPSGEITVTVDQSEPTIHVPVKIAPTPSNSGNGMVWCSGPQSPGYNVSTHTCQPFSTTTNSITPHPAQAQVVRLSQLPYTGTDDLTIMFALCFSVVMGLVIAYYSRRFI